MNINQIFEPILNHELNFNDIIFLNNQLSLSMRSYCSSYKKLYRYVAKSLIISLSLSLSLLLKFQIPKVSAIKDHARLTLWLQFLPSFFYSYTQQIQQMQSVRSKVREKVHKY